MNLHTLGDFIFNVLNILVIIFFSVLLSAFTFSIFIFPLITAILITVRNTFIYNKGYFYKTFFSTIIYVVKNYYKAGLLFYIIFLVFSAIGYYAIFTPVPMFFIFSSFIFSSLFFVLITVSGGICTLKKMKTSELITNAILISIKFKSFILSMLVITYFLIFLYLKINILFFILSIIVYVLLISYIMEYGIVVNFKSEEIKSE